MRNNALVLTLAAIASLLAQSSSSYRVTRTYTLGGDGSWTTSYPIPRIIGCSSGDRIASWSSTKTPGRCSARSPA